MTAPALHPYRIRCAGLEYITLASGGAQAIADAIALHAVPRVSAKPMNYAFTSGAADCIRLQHPQQRFFAIQGGAA